MQVRATSLDPAEPLAALIAGAYYSSTGPEITAVDLDAGDVVHVTRSPAARVILIGGRRGCQLVTGEGLTRVTIPLGFLADASYIRVTVVDPAGDRAWTNPCWLT